VGARRGGRKEWESEVGRKGSVGRGWGVGRYGVSGGREGGHRRTKKKRSEGGGVKRRGG